MKKHFLIIFISLCNIFVAFHSIGNTIEKDFASEEIQFSRLLSEDVFDYEEYDQIRKKKVNSTILAVLLGPFGVHRLYLGTEAKVPVIYTITLGGGFGILPLIDMITVLSSKDISRFENNGQVIMWND